MHLADADVNAAGDAGRQHIQRQLYAHAFTRFLNYMSSILQTRQLKNMYTTAHELGLDSFLVDLRHLCAHGHDLPALDVFQRSATHLLDWLHTFYWQREHEHIRDAHVQDVRPPKAADYQAYVESLLHVYDTCTEALFRRCRLLSDLRGGQPFADEQQAWSLKKYGVYHKLDRLTVIAGRVTNELAQLAARESRVRGNDVIFCEALLRCQYFMSSAAAAQQPKRSEAQQQRIGELVALHQNLFRALAVCGLVEPCFQALIALCEDEHAPEQRRRGAQFWANRVAEGFALFKRVKRVFKAKKERNAEFELDLAPLNTDGMTKEMREVYRRLGVNCGEVLIFGDTIRRPWTLTFSRRYMQERAVVVNEFTRAVLERCMELVEPALTDAEVAQLRGLMALMVRADEEGSASEGTQQSGSTVDDVVYAVDERAEEQVTRLVGAEEVVAEAALEVDAEGQKQWGVWSEVSDGFDWKAVPLGRVPWE